MTRPDLVEMAVIGAAQGLKGEVRVKSFGAEPEALGRYGALVAEDGRAFTVEALRGAGGEMLVVRFKGVSDRTAAEKLNGTRLFVPRAALPPAEEEEFYHADLVGLAVRNDSGETIGRVSAVHDFGGGDVLEIIHGAQRGVMIPFSRAAVPVVNIAEGFLSVDLQAAGLIENEKDGGEEEE